MLQFIAKRDQYVAIKIQHQLESSKLESIGEGNWRISPQLPCFLYDGCIFSWLDPSR